MHCLDGVDLAALPVREFDGRNWEGGDGKARAVAMIDALDGTIQNGRHTMAVQLLFEDTDFTGIVYHANYLASWSVGRSNYLRLLGGPVEEAAQEAPGFAFVVRSMQIEFLKSARMDEVLEVITEYAEIKGASIMLEQDVRRGGDLLVTALVRVAFVSDGRARPIPRPLRGVMQGEPPQPRPERRVGRRR